MPLVRNDVNEGRSPVRLQSLSQGVHEAILAEYGIPERDYFHILTEHPAGQIFAQDAGLGFERTNDVVMIQNFTQGGRSQEAKQALFAAVAERLSELGVAGENVLIGYVETRPATGLSASAGRNTSPVSWKYLRNGPSVGTATARRR
jgi:hypothetical protein